MSRLVIPAIVAGAAACAAATQVYIAPSNETITASVEDPASGAPADVIYVENRSSVPVEVRSITLLDCENISLRCDEPIRLATRLEPGSRRPMLRVLPANRARSYRFRYHFAWQGISGETDLGQVRRVLDTALSAPVPMGPPTQLRGRPLAVGLDSLVMVVGERVSFPSLSRGVHATDSAGGAEPLVAVDDETIASVAGGRELFALKPGRTEVMIRAPGGLMRVPLLVRSAPAGEAVEELLVRPDSLVVRVGERLSLSRALTVTLRRPSGEVVPAMGWSLYVEDESIVGLGAGELIGRRPGRSAIVLGIQRSRARVPVIVTP